MKPSALFTPILGAMFVLVTYPCSFMIIPHQLDPTEQKLDHLPPSPPRMSVLNVKRGRAAGPDGQGSSCNDMGEISLKLEQAARDNRTPPEKMGYLWQVREGQVPAGLAPPVGPVRLTAEGILPLFWIDGSTDDQEPLEFSITVSAFDLAGNQSEPSADIQIRHPGNR